MFRILWDAGVCLAISVIVCRFFIVESYMIQTGSMAPNLWGYHKHIYCPACQFVFARGAYDESSNSTGQLPARCPNCGLEPLKCDELRRTEGDQILVHKLAFPFVPLKRWDVIVFQSPAPAKEAYVKRLIALPGESLSVKSGDIYINEQIARKPLSKQRQMFIPIYDDRFRSPLTGANEGYSRWWPIQNPATNLESTTHDVPGWLKTVNGFSISANDQRCCLKYHHPAQQAIAVYATNLSNWPENLPYAESLMANLSYVKPLKKLTHRGVLSRQEVDQLLKAHPIPADLKQSLEELFWLSQGFTQGRIIANDYAYNGIVTVDRILEHHVHDFKLDLDLEASFDEGMLSLNLTDGRHPYDLVLDFSQQEIRLLMEGNIVRTAKFPEYLLKRKKIHLEFSTCDAALYVAINQRELFEPFAYLPQEPQVENFPYICKVYAQNLTANISNLILSRDIHYEISTDDLHRVHRTLGVDELFLLGDNTPASQDSRKWPAGSVTTKLLIGKPLIVHLPSRTGEFNFMGQKKKIRLPDFSRMHWVQ